MIDLAVILPLFVMGLVSSAHCIGMCGGIMGALTMAIPRKAKSSRWLILVTYNLGRICSYAIMGALAGLFAEQFAAMGGGIVLRVLAGALLIAMGLYLADWWRGLTKLETVGRYLWVYIQPIGKRLMPVDTATKALFLGAVWGWLPCGLVYSALALAMTQPSAGLAAGSMLAFGLGTLPAVLMAGVAARQLTAILQKPGLRKGLALVVIAFGVWTIWGGLGHSHAHHHVGSHRASDHTGMDHTTMDHSAIDHSANHSTMDHAIPDHTTMDHSVMGHSGTEHEGTDHSTMDHTEMDHTTVDHGAMHHQEASERQRTDDGSGAVEDKISSSDSNASAGMSSEATRGGR